MRKVKLYKRKSHPYDKYGWIDWVLFAVIIVIIIMKKLYENRYSTGGW